MQYSNLHKYKDEEINAHVLNIKSQCVSQKNDTTDINVIDKKEVFDIVQPYLFEDKKEKIFHGILANTYILLLENNSILLIDQHALHEKILYEEYLNNFKEKKTIIKQPLLFEEIIIISNEQKIVLESDKSVFNEVGIYYDCTENTVIIKSFPTNFLKFNIV